MTQKDFADWIGAVHALYQSSGVSPAQGPFGRLAYWSGAGIADHSARIAGLIFGPMVLGLYAGLDQQGAARGSSLIVTRVSLRRGGPHHHVG
jgi:hypothetical protein